MKVAAYQAPVLNSGSLDALTLIPQRVERCEAEGIAFLCCPAAILGGSADHSEDPTRFAVATGGIGVVLAPLASDTVTIVFCFTEQADDGRLYNSAAVWHRGTVAGVYRKRHPAIRQSVYSAGTDAPVFRIDGLAFGIVICYDSTFSEPALRIAAQGATVLFVPTNNGLPHSRAGEDLVAQAQEADVARATENHMWIIRAAVAVWTTALVSVGCSEIVGPDGVVVLHAGRFAEHLLVADVGRSAA